MSYNGWTNYETWAVNLWVMNDEVSYNATFDLHTPEDCEEFVRDLQGTPVYNGILQDIGGLEKLSRVNWVEICDLWNE